MSFRKSAADIGSSLKYLRLAFTAARMKFTIVTPGNFHGILERQEEAFVASVLGRQSQQIHTVKIGGAACHCKTGVAREHARESTLTRAVPDP